MFSIKMLRQRRLKLKSFLLLLLQWLSSQLVFFMPIQARPPAHKMNL